MISKISKTGRSITNSNYEDSYSKDDFEDSSVIGASQRLHEVSKKSEVEKISEETIEVDIPEEIENEDSIEE